MCVCPQRSAGSEDHECVCVCVCVCAHLYMRALSQKAQSLPLEKGTGSGGRVLGEGGERCWRGRSFGLLGRSLVSKKNEIWGTRNLEKRLNTRLSRMFPKAEGEGSCRGQACFWKQFIPQKKGIKRALASHVPLPSFLSSLLSPLDVPLPLAPLPPSLPAFPPSCRWMRSGEGRMRSRAEAAAAPGGTSSGVLLFGIPSKSQKPSPKEHWVPLKTF